MCINVIKNKKTIVLIIIVLLLSIVISVISFFSKSNDFVVDFVPYEIVKQFLLYDHIVYNGVDYYYMKDEVYIPNETNTREFITKDVYVVLVNKEGIPYKQGKHEEAWLLKHDAEKNYIYYNSAYFTKIKSLAIEAYGFQD